MVYKGQTPSLPASALFTVHTGHTQRWSPIVCEFSIHHSLTYTACAQTPLGVKWNFTFPYFYTSYFNDFF